MLATRLQEQIGIPPQAMKKRTVNRSIFTYCGPRKKQFLAMNICMMVNRVLPDHGQPVSYRRELTHEYLASACGLDSRATWTHWQSYFRDNTDKDVRPVLWSRRQMMAPNRYKTLIPEKKGTEWVIYRISTGKAVPRGRFMDEAQAHARCKELNEQLRTVKGPRSAKELTEHLDFLRKAIPLVSESSRQSYLAQQRTIDYQVRGRALPEDRFFYGDIEQIMDDPRYSDLFSLELAEELNLHGFKDIPEWVWHPCLGVSYTARLVLTYYICCGILEGPGWIQVRQPKVCKCLGISVKTLFAAECELDTVGLLRVVGQRRGQKPELKPWLDLDPEWRTVNKILFLPIRKMLDEEILAERRRLLAARRALHQQRQGIRRRLRKLRLSQELERAGEQKRFTLALQACRATRLHRELVEACKGQTSRINALWDAAIMKLIDAGVHQKLILALIPQVLAPPGHAGQPIRLDPYKKEQEIRGIITASLKSAAARRE
jgi:hypothetical protein